MLPEETLAPDERGRQQAKRSGRRRGRNPWTCTVMELQETTFAVEYTFSFWFARADAERCEWTAYRGKYPALERHPCEWIEHTGRQGLQRPTTALEARRLRQSIAPVSEAPAHSPRHVHAEAVLTVFQNYPEQYVVARWGPQVSKSSHPSLAAECTSYGSCACISHAVVDTKTADGSNFDPRISSVPSHLSHNRQRLSNSGNGKSAHGTHTLLHRPTMSHKNCNYSAQQKLLGNKAPRTTLHGCKRVESKERTRVLRSYPHVRDNIFW